MTRSGLMCQLFVVFGSQRSWLPQRQVIKHQDNMMPKTYHSKCEDLHLHSSQKQRLYSRAVIIIHYVRNTFGGSQPNRNYQQLYTEEKVTELCFQKPLCWIETKAQGFRQSHISKHTNTTTNTQQDIGTQTCAITEHRGDYNISPLYPDQTRSNYFPSVMPVSCCLMPAFQTTQGFIVGSA